MIRRAAKSDFHSIADLLRLAQKESPNYSDYDEGVAATSLRVLLESSEAIVLVMDIDGVRGVLAASVGPSWYERGNVASTIFWYVHPDYRGHGWRLLKAFIKVCKTYRLIVEIVAGATFSNDPRVFKMFERLGFSHKTKDYFMRLK